MDKTAYINFEESLKQDLSAALEEWENNQESDWNPDPILLKCSVFNFYT